MKHNWIIVDTQPLRVHNLSGGTCNSNSFCESKEGRLWANLSDKVVQLCEEGKKEQALQEIIRFQQQ